MDTNRTYKVDVFDRNRLPGPDTMIFLAQRTTQRHCLEKVPSLVAIQQSNAQLTRHKNTRACGLLIN